MSRRRRVLRAVAGGFVLIDLVHRVRDILFGTDVPRIEYWILGVDVLVLLAILWFEGLTELRHRRENATRKRLAEYAQFLTPFITKGQKLLQDVPRPLPVTAFIQDGFWLQWVSAVQTWANETHAFIATLSPKAATSFALVINFAVLDPAVYIPDGPPSEFLLSNSYRETYLRFLTQLENLRKIIEKPEGYF